MSDHTSLPAGGLGRAVRDRRKLGLTQQELAELAVTTQRFVSTLETGKPTLRLDKVVAVLDTVGLTLVPVAHDRVDAVDRLLGGCDG